MTPGITGLIAQVGTLFIYLYLFLISLCDAGITGLIAQYAAGELGKDEDGVYPKPPPNYR